MAAELVGGALISSSLRFLFERFGSGEVLAYLRGKSKGCDFDELVEKLKMVLNSVLAVLEDAEQKQMRNKRVEAWLDMLQEAVFDGEDLLDVIESDAQQLKKKVEVSADISKPCNLLKTKQKLRNLFSRSHGFEKGDMESNVKKLLERLEKIANQKDLLGLENVVGKTSSWRLPSTSLVDESELFGREDEIDEMIKLLLSDNVGSGNLCVISIVGMGGIGKTTLSQSAFNDPRVIGHFELKAWACVSEEFSVFTVTKRILEEVTLEACSVEGLNLLQVKLRESLTGKKFLIVLDDVWCENSEYLGVMIKPFNYGAQGSKIIITTRSEKVASILGPDDTHHHLRTLSKAASWQLFAKKASIINGNFTGNQDLENIGRKIVEKCKGLPLALKTLGGLLCSTQDVGEWERVLKSDIWDLTEDDSKILPALKLSYAYLPSQIKRCFAYCSIFPKDYEFEKEDLILLWMAENLVEHPKRNLRIEEVGEQYFRCLESRSFFQRSSTHKSSSHKTTNKSIFVMHDLIHDLAKFVSSDYCLHLDGMSGEINVKKARHLAYFSTKGDPYKRFNDILQATNLRTFLPLPGLRTYRMISVKAVDGLLLKLRCLRVLSLSKYVNVKSLPDSISELIRLRCLDLSHTNIFKLPQSVCKLVNLQTLKMNSCRKLEELPRDMHHLINLRHLDVRFCDNLKEMPAQLSKLKNLQTLSTFIVGKEIGNTIGELRELSDLKGKLCIKKLENVGSAKGATDLAKLTDKKHLESLRLEWNFYGEEHAEHARDVLGKLLPNRTLKNLCIYGYPGKEFPNWLGSNSLGNVVSVALTECRNCLSLPPLGQLQSLKVLEVSSLSSLKTVGPEFYGDGFKPFPSLKTLRFHDMSSWVKWFHGDSGGFSELIELELRRCCKLTGDLPCVLPSLTKLSISHCKELVSSLPRIPRVLELRVDSCENMLQLQSFTEPLKQVESCQDIHLAGCSSLIPTPIGFLPPSLQSLCIDTCDSLISMPLDSFPKLKTLKIISSKSLESLSMCAGLCQNLTSLHSLGIYYCPNFISFPIDGLPAPNLTRLSILQCNKLKSLPKKMHELLSSLDYLSIEGCPEIESFSEAGLPFSLSDLYISGCDKLIASRNSWDLKRLPNLRRFDIGGTNEDVVSFPEEGLLPPTIISLDIHTFRCLKSLDKQGLLQLTSLQRLSINSPKLQKIQGQELGSSLKSLYIYSCNDLQVMSEEGLPTSLESLIIWNCPKLQTMPKNGFPTSLQYLTIEECPLLAKKCRREKGKYWNKISHIYCVKIDDEIVT